MTIKNKARFAGFMAAAALVVGASASSAQTSASDLQAQINALMAQLAALQAPAATVTFTSDLTIGSTGPQVVALQTFLESKGYLVMPVGVAKGYFGALTRAALARFQAANGIAPAVGYFGPITRARINGMIVVTPGGPVIVVPGTPGAGSEGQLDNDDQLGSIASEDLEEGDEEAEVLGVEFDAEDSDMRIDRVDVDFEATSVTGSDNLDDYVSNVSLWLDGKKLADADTDDADEDDDVYSFRFTGLNGMVDEGDTAQLVVAVDVNSSVDSGDDSTWTVTIPADGIRATDTKGISDTYFSSAYDETFTVGEAAAGDADVSEASDNPDSTTVEVDEDNDTEDIEMLAFEIESNESDITIEDLFVTVRVSTSSVAAVVKSVSLFHGSTLLATESASSTTAVDFVLFDDLDITVNEDDTEAFSVEITVNDLAAGASGVGFYAGTMASTTVTGSLIEAEDANGDSVTIGGTATGEDMTFRDEGIAVELVSSTETVSDTSETETNDRGTYTLVMDITAFGDDVYVDSQSGTSTDGFQWSVTGDAFSGSGTSNVTCSGCDEGTGNFLVEEGETERFTLTVVLVNTNGAAGFYGVQVDEIGTGSGDDATAETTVTSGLEDLESDEVNLET
jgi:hypothetical protein